MIFFLNDFEGTFIVIIKDIPYSRENSIILVNLKIKFFYFLLNSDTNLNLFIHFFFPYFYKNKYAKEEICKKTIAFKSIELYSMKINIKY